MGKITEKKERAAAKKNNQHPPHTDQIQLKEETLS